MFVCISGDSVCGGLRGKELFLISLRGVLKLFEEKILRK